MTKEFILEQLLKAKRADETGVAEGVQIHDSSDLALNTKRVALRDPSARKFAGAKTKYPWATIPVGKSFCPDCGFASARVMAYNAAKRYSRKFRVVQHPNLVVEIARIG